MTIWEAYCDIKLRNTYKHEYLAAQGMTPAKAQDIMTKFKTYIDRFNGIPDIVEIRAVESVEKMMAVLNHIFMYKWQNHIKDSYRMMPEVFTQYGRFLLSENIRRKEPIFSDEKSEGEMTVAESACHELTEYEKPYLSPNGKLNIIANPVLIAKLKKRMNNDFMDEFALLETARNFYGEQFHYMTNLDWQKLLKALLTIDRKKAVSRTGAKKTKIHLRIGDVVDTVTQPAIALGIVCNFVGKEKVADMRLKLKGEALLLKYLPMGKEKFFQPFDDGWFMNVGGDTKEKVKLIRMLAIHFHIDVKADIVIE